MEAVLNIVWLLIATVTFVATIWLSPRDRRHLPPQLVALLFVLVLLLPIISISDDLQAETFVVEQPAAKDFITKRTMSGAAYSSRTIPKLGIAIVPAPLSAMLRWTSWRSSEETFDSSLDSPALRLTLGPAPPRLVA